jgi:RNA polymerase sigma-70 factor (ECF subfamily)
MHSRTQFQSVLAAAQAGAEWALTALYRDFQPRLLGYFRAHAHTEAEDLASEVWADVAQGIGQFVGEESAFRAWLFTIAHRRVIDLRRRRARRREDPVAPDLLWDAYDANDRPSTAVHEGALAYLAALPPEQAEIVLLRVVAGLDSNEVGAVTGRKPGTVRVLQKRALERLAALIADESRSGVTR